MWLDRFEERGLEEALYDEPKPGRPSKLSDEQLDELEEILHQSSDEAGYDIQAWTPKFIQHWLKTQYGVEYTLRHVRRLMDDAGLSWRTARPEHHELDPEEVAEFQDTLKKKRQGLIDAGKTILTVDQHHNPVATTLRRGWFRSASQPTVDVVGSRDSVTVLGAVSHEEETF